MSTIVILGTRGLGLKSWKYRLIDLIEPRRDACWADLVSWAEYGGSMRDLRDLLDSGTERCQRDCLANGNCYCGRLRRLEAPAAPAAWTAENQASLVRLLAMKEPSEEEWKALLDLQSKRNRYLMGQIVAAARKLDELRPCPFCGGTAPRQLRIEKEPRFGPETPADEPEGWAYQIRCGGCGAAGGWAKGPGFPGDGSEEDRLEMGPCGARRWWNMRWPS